MNAKKTAYLGLYISFAMILSYLETLVPPLASIPGVKVGLANIVIIIMLYKGGIKQAFTVSISRVLLMGILFGNTLSIVYSLAGAIISLTGMSLLKKTNSLSYVGISVAGGVLHNIGQIITACFIVETAQLVYYLPILLVSGTVAGTLIGFIAALLVKRFDKIKL